MMRPALGPSTSGMWRAVASGESHLLAADANGCSIHILVF